MQDLCKLWADPAEAAEARISVDGTPVVVEGPSMMSYYLSVIGPRGTAAHIGNTRQHDEAALALMDMPIFRTFDGYVIREGFAFSYYRLDEADELEALELQR